MNGTESPARAAFARTGRLVEPAPDRAGHDGGSSTEPSSPGTPPGTRLGIRLRRRARALLLAPALRLARLAFGWLPWSRAQAAGRVLGSLAWRLSRRDRARSLRHLTLAFPEMPAGERTKLGQASFRHLGTAIGELLHVWGNPPERACRHVRVEGFEQVEGLRGSGRPILVLTGHCGNWELISSANGSHGLGLAAIARELDDAGLQQISVDLRAHLGSETIARGSRSSSRQLLRTLRSGGALCLLIDQDIASADGVWVPFFGRLAHTPTAAAELALRLGAAVVPTFSERLQDGSHLLTFHPPLELPADLTEATARMTSAIEAQIRRRPEQWVWMHRRWRQRPPGEGPEPSP